MIVLASKSASRMAMLRAACVDFETHPADIDERALEKSLGNALAEDIALSLAEAKASAVSKKLCDRLVLGSDSLVSIEGRRFDKPVSKEDAAEHLRLFSGKAMRLLSAASLVRNGEMLWSHVSEATLHVRPLSETFIGTYLDAEWPSVAGCVGVFRIEAMGPQLFSHIEGDQFTVLGMPLLAVLEALRVEGELLR